MTQSVIISGGGIVGSFLGLELAARNIPFKIIEKKDFDISHTDHIRTLTLNLIGCERLEQLEVDAASASIQTMKVLDGSGSGKLSFHSDDADLDLSLIHI